MLRDLFDETDGRSVARVEQATSLRGRLRGLAFTPVPRGEQGLAIRAKQIHTFGMRFDIDVIFCDRSGEVLRVFRGMKPGRCTPIVRRARVVYELPAGVGERVGVGHRLCIRDL